MVKLTVKDKVIKTLLEEGELYINQISEEIDHPYSYVHRIIKDLEKEGAVELRKEKRKGRKITLVKVTEGYEHKWLISIKRTFKPIIKNVELVTAFIVSLVYGIYKFKNTSEIGLRDMMAPTEALEVTEKTSKSFFKTYEFFVIFLIFVLVLVWVFRKKRVGN